MNIDKWNSYNIPDQSGRIIIVTGSNSGIGFEASKVLAGKNAKIILAVRNLDKGNLAKEKILIQYPQAALDVMELDLSDLSSIREFVREFNVRFTRLDLLINNAGVMIPPYTKTKDGFELQIGTNHLGHFALTLQMLDLLNDTNGSRVVNVSSAAHNYGNIDFNDLNWEKRKYKAWRAYGDSKIANLYFTFELQRKLKESGSAVLVTAAHPGWTATDLQRHSGLLEYLNRFFAMEGWQGALPTLRAAVDDDAKGGDYFGPSGFMEWKGYPVRVGTNKLAQDENIASKLWDVSEQLTGVKYMHQSNLVEYDEVS